MSIDPNDPRRDDIIPRKHGVGHKLPVALVLVGAIAFCILRSKFAAHPADHVAISAPDVLTAEYQKLGQEYDRLAEAQSAAPAATANNGAAIADENVSDDQWLAQLLAADPKRPDPDEQMMPRFFEFAQRHPNSALAFDALFMVIRRGGPQTGNVRGKPWQLKEQALDVVWAQHRDDARIVHLLELLGDSLPSQKTEAFLKRAMESGPTRAVRAAATFDLARYYHTLALHHKHSRDFGKKPTPNNLERFWKIVVAPYLQNFPIDEEKNSAELGRLLAVVIAEHADVPATSWQLVGPGRWLLIDTPDEKPKTYGELARSMLFEVNHITPGKPAPEIFGTDADGKTFCLSDYRGQVVLLTFSADWCGGCVALYPLERNLIEKFRGQPFTILSVMRDEKIGTLKSATASGEITWRCWWDGMEGPIRDAWNNSGIPNLYLLDDQHIIQDVSLTRLARQEEFEQAIEPLVKRAAARASAPQ